MATTIARGSSQATIKNGRFVDVVGFDVQGLEWLADLVGDDSPSIGDPDLYLARALCAKLPGAEVVRHERPSYTPGAIY